MTDEQEASCRVFRIYVDVPAHYHKTCDEYLFIVSGRGMFKIGEKDWFEATAGQLIFFKKSTVHAITLLDEAAARIPGRRHAAAGSEGHSLRESRRRHAGDVYQTRKIYLGACAGSRRLHGVPVAHARLLEHPTTLNANYNQGTVSATLASNGWTGYRLDAVVARAWDRLAEDLDRAEVDVSAGAVAAAGHQIGKADFIDLAEIRIVTQISLFGLAGPAPRPPLTVTTRIGSRRIQRTSDSANSFTVSIGTEASAWSPTSIVPSQASRPDGRHGNPMS